MVTRICYRSLNEPLQDATPDVPDHRDGIMGCSAREDEIADHVEAMFLPSDEHRELVAGIIPKAEDPYYAAFDGLHR
jgi:hypothetical protein